MQLFVWLQDDSDVYILTKVSDVLHSMFSCYREKVLPWFEQILPLIVNLIVSVQQKKDSRLAPFFPILFY